MMPIVVTPHRFRTKQQFWSYCGLGITMRSSSDRVRATDGGWARARVQRTRGLSRNHNHTLKATFKGAATTVITQSKTCPVYDDHRRRLNAGTKPNLAKLTVARKIAAAVLRMWKDGEVYRSNRETPKTSESNSSDRLCPCGVPKEAIAARGPDGRVAPTSRWRTDKLSQRPMR